MEDIQIVEQLAQSLGGPESLQQILDYLAMHNTEKSGQQPDEQSDAYNKNDLQLENEEMTPDSNESLLNQLKQMDSEQITQFLQQGIKEGTIQDTEETAEALQ